MTKNILFITSTRIGDAILSTGVLSYLLRTYPEAQITVACGPLVKSLFEGVPQLERVIPLKKESWNRHWIKLWRQTVGTKWDIVVDLRNSAVSRLISSQERFVYGSHIDKKLHKVAQNAAVIGKDEQVAHPRLFPTDAQIAKAKSMISDETPVLGVGPTANWIGKIWPVENFVRLVTDLTQEGEIFAGWRVAVFGAPGEEDIAYKLYNALPEATRIDCIAKGTPGEAAALIAQCDFYIGNDSGLMHSAAAAGVRTVGLFGPTNDQLYAPYGLQTLTIRTPQSFEDLTGAAHFVAKDVKVSLMGGLTVETVKARIKEFVASHHP